MMSKLEMTNQIINTLKNGIKNGITNDVTSDTLLLMDIAQSLSIIADALSKKNGSDIKEED